jgi:molybdopterin synthase catalytic subunit
MSSSDVGVHQKGTISLVQLIDSVKTGSDFEKAGAIGLFVGVVRGKTAKGEKVMKLELDAYEEKANEVLRSICSGLKKKPGIVDVQIHHLLGEFSVGEDLVYVMVAGSHRASVFSVLKEAVESYKREAPIFKKELVVAENGETRSCWVTEKENH